MTRQNPSDHQLLTKLFFRLLPFQVLLIVILRIRDNCEAFNPTEHAKLMDPGEMGKNVGIRLVYGMARDVSYQNLLGLNVLTMRI